MELSVTIEELPVVHLHFRRNMSPGAAAIVWELDFDRYDDTTNRYLYTAVHNWEFPQKIENIELVENLAFADVTGDNRLHVIRITPVSFLNSRLWQYCRYNGPRELMDDWVNLSIDNSFPGEFYNLNTDMKVINLNNDSRGDVLYRKAADQWYVWYDMEVPCTWQRIYPDTEKPLGNIGFGNFINDEANGEPIRTDFFMYKQSTIR